MTKVAYIASKRLGDSLIGMVLFNNLQQNGYEVAIYGDFLYQLKSYFNRFHIYSRSDFSSELVEYFDYFITEFPPEIPPCLQDKDNHICLYNRKYYKAVRHLVDVQLYAAKDLFNIPEAKLVSNPGANFNDNKYRSHSSRIIIASTARDPHKQWGFSNFINLANCLTEAGYNPQFVVAPHEVKHCKPVEEAGYKLNTFCSLYDAAEYIRQSGYFIGNTSGLSHLASMLRIPTVGITFRKGDKKHWEPFWGNTITVVPSNLFTLPKKLKEKYWQKFLSVRSVLNNFKVLTRETNKN